MQWCTLVHRNATVQLYNNGPRWHQTGTAQSCQHQLCIPSCQQCHHICTGDDNNSYTSWPVRLIQLVWNIAADILRQNTIWPLIYLVSSITCITRKGQKLVALNTFRDKYKLINWRMLIKYSNELMIHLETRCTKCYTGSTDLQWWQSPGSLMIGLISPHHTLLWCGVRWCWNWFLIWTRLELECCLMNFSSHFHIYKNTNTSDLGQVLKSSGHHTSVSSCKTSLLLMLDKLGFVLVLLMDVQDLKYLDL